MKKILSLLCVLFCAVNLFAQETVSQEVTMADQLRADGKIWVVVVVVAIVFVGIIVYLFSIDRKISKIEKELEK